MRAVRATGTVPGWLRATAALTALFLCAGGGCDEMFWKHRPSPSDYWARYFSRFGEVRVKTLDFTYAGSIGGEGTAARAVIEGGGPIKVDLRGAVAGIYEPAELRDVGARLDFEDRWAAPTHGRLPAWYDFPYERRMRTVTETHAQTASSPAYCFVWYLDDERGVVYFLGVTE